MKSGKGSHETDDGAVGVAYEETLVELIDRSLVGDEVEVGEVDGRHDKGNERIATVVLGVGEDGDFGVQEFLFYFAAAVSIIFMNQPRRL